MASTPPAAAPPAAGGAGGDETKPRISTGFLKSFRAVACLEESVGVGMGVGAIMWANTFYQNRGVQSRIKLFGQSVSTRHLRAANAAVLSFLGVGVTYGVWCRHSQKITRDNLKLMMERQSVPREEVKKPWEYVETLPPSQALAITGAATAAARTGTPAKTATDAELNNLLFNPQSLGDAKPMQQPPTPATPAPTANNKTK